MKYLLMFSIILSVFDVQAQDSHNNCVAVFIGEDMVVDEFSPRGKSIITQNTKGKLSVNLVEVGDEVIKGKPVGFYIALKDSKTRTLTMWNKKATNTINVESVLKKTQSGDKIVLILADEAYALPQEQHEISVSN